MQLGFFMGTKEPKFYVTLIENGVFGEVISLSPIKTTLNDLKSRCNLYKSPSPRSF